MADKAGREVEKKQETHLPYKRPKIWILPVISHNNKQQTRRVVPFLVRLHPPGLQKPLLLLLCKPQNLVAQLSKPRRRSVRQLRRELDLALAKDHDAGVRRPGDALSVGDEDARLDITA